MEKLVEEMTAAALKHPYNINATTLVPVECGRNVTIEGHNFDICFSYNVFTPVHDSKSWHLSITADEDLPNPFVKKLVQAFLGEHYMEITDQAKVLMEAAGIICKSRQFMKPINKG